MDASPPDPRPATVLVVDDDEDVLALARRILRPTGWSVATAPDAGRALDVARQLDHLDVLFTDLVMPGRSGVDLARALLAERPGVTVTCTTGQADDAMRAEVVAAGWPLLPKPYTPDVVRRFLGEAVDRRTSADAP
jgi:CheY-like chemotaxis protein